MARTRSAVLCVTLVSLALVLPAPSPAAACSCSTPSVEWALASSALVAEVEILEVGPPASDSDMTSQLMRMRVLRVFSTSTSVGDGDEIVILHMTCNSMPYDRTAVGGRWIAFLGADGGRLSHHYCSLSLSPLSPLPHVLVQERRRWLARRLQ